MKYIKGKNKWGNTKRPYTNTKIKENKLKKEEKSIEKKENNLYNDKNYIILRRETPHLSIIYTYKKKKKEKKKKETFWNLFRRSASSSAPQLDTRHSCLPTCMPSFRLG